MIKWKKIWKEAADVICMAEVNKITKKYELRYLVSQPRFEPNNSPICLQVRNVSRWVKNKRERKKRKEKIKKDYVLFLLYM
jgi:hypothetical protein